MYETLPVSDNRSAYDKVQDLLRKGDNDAARKGQKTVGALGRIMALEGHAHLNNTPAKDDQTDSTDKAEDEITESRCIRAPGQGSLPAPHRHGNPS